MTALVRFLTPARRRLIVVAVALVAFGLGVWGLDQQLVGQPALNRSPGDRVYYALQLFTLDSAPLAEESPTTWMLNVARYLAPLATVLAVVETIGSAFRTEWRAWRTRRSSGHPIVCGDGEEAVRLAWALRDAGEDVILVGRDVAGQADAGLRVVAGNPTDPATLQAARADRAREVFALVDDGLANASVALAVRSMSRSTPVRVAVYARITDGRLCAALRARRVGAPSDPDIGLEFFSTEDIAARALLDSPAEGASPSAPPWVEGDGAFAAAVRREVERRAAERGLTHADLVPTAAQRPVYICHDDPDRAMLAGLDALAGGAGDVTVCLRRYVTVGDVFDGSKRLLDTGDQRLRTFDVLEAACLPDHLRADLMEALARGVHDGYLAGCRARAETPATNPSMRPWRELGAVLQESNRAQARDIRDKMAAIGVVVVPAGSGADVVFAPHEVDHLARQEHQRWMDERRAQGFVWGPARDDRHHPDLVDWDELDEAAKDKDRATVTGLPALLASAGLGLVRLEGGAAPAPAGAPGPG